MTFRELREQAGFRFGSDLASVTGVKQTTVSQLDLGKTPDPRWSTVEVLSAAIGVTPSALMQAVRESVSAHQRVS